MHGHWIGGTRKLNKHYQSGDGGGGLDMVLWGATTMTGAQGSIPQTTLPQTGLLGLLLVPRSAQDYYPRKASWVFVWHIKSNSSGTVNYPYQATEQDVTDRLDILTVPQAHFRYYRDTYVYASSGPSQASIAAGDTITIVIKSKASRYGKACAFVYTLQAVANGDIIITNFMRFTRQRVSDPDIFVNKVTHGDTAGVKGLWDVIFDANTWTEKTYRLNGQVIEEDEDGTAAPTPATCDLTYGNDEMEIIFTKKDNTFSSGNVGNVTWREIINPEYIRGLQIIDVETVEK